MSCLMMRARAVSEMANYRRWGDGGSIIASATRRAGRREEKYCSVCENKEASD